MTFSYVLGKMLSLAVMMLLGFAANKGGILDGHANKSLSDLVVNITTPCMMLAALSATKARRSDLLLMIVCAVIMFGLFFLAAQVIPKRLPVPEKEVPAYKYFTIFTNNGFMGFPIVKALWGNKALIYASLINIPVSIMMYTYGIWLYSNKSGEHAKFSLRKLINIPNISAVLVLILALLKVGFGGPVQDTLSVIGDATVPLSMIVVGSTLAERAQNGKFRDWMVYVFAAVRLLEFPLAVFGLVYFLPIDPLIKGVLVIIAAMPGSANGVLFAQQYSYNRTVSSWYVFVSTVMSVLTIPLISVIVLAPLGI